MPKIGDIIRLLENIAPLRLAENWDNVGLHYGDPDWPVSHVFACLDPTIQAVNAAAAVGADLLVTHHPLIFKPLKNLNTKTPVGAVIDCAARRRIAVFCAHTNLDSAFGGINDVLAEKIGLNVTGPLSFVPEVQRYKLVVFAPSSDTKSIYTAISQTHSVRICNYNGCSFYSDGNGRFIPERAEDVRIEIPVLEADIHDVVKKVKSAHSHETVLYDIYPLNREKSGNGIGRIGEFQRTRSLVDTAHEIKQALSLKTVKIAGHPDLQIKTAAVCSGGGSQMIEDFLASGTHAYISGDLGHHAAIDIAGNNLGVIDIGHFASEQVAIPVICSRLEKEMEKESISVPVTPWTNETDPFTCI